MAYIDDYTPKQYTGFEPEFSDGFVTTLGLSVANGIERAVNMTALYSNEYNKFMTSRSLKYLKKNYSDDSRANYEAALLEKEVEDYKLAIEKRKENQIRLEEIVNETAEIHKLGAPARLTNNLVAGFVEGLNPVEMVADYMSGAIAGKVVGWASRGKKVGKFMNASRRALAESALTGAAGGGYNAFQMNYIYDDVTTEQMLTAVGSGALFSIALNRVGNYLGNRKKIKTPEEFAEFKKAIRGDTITDPKIKRKAAQFMSSIQELKSKTDLSNEDLVMNTIDKIIDTHFLTGKKISKEEILDMLVMPKHSEGYESVLKAMSSGHAREAILEYESNRQLKKEVSQEFMELSENPEIKQAMKELGENRLRLDEIYLKGELSDIEKAEAISVEKKIAELEKVVNIEAYDELEAQIYRLDLEGKELKEMIDEELKEYGLNYDIDSYLAEKYKYQEDFLTPNVDKIVQSLGEDVKSESVKENDYIGPDPSKQSEIIEEDMKSGKININDEELKNKVTEFNDIEKDWTNNISEKTDLIKQWVSQGCEL